MGACEDCSKWEENMYWTHFKKMHFWVSLAGDFADELAIPKKFANNIKEKLPKAVTLKGPSGVTWNVGLVTNGDNVFFKTGWKEFVNNHSLEENDLLVFKYYGDSRFDVLMFDQRSSCEKETSYFVRKCGQTKLEFGYHMTGKARDSSVEAIHATVDGFGSGHKKLDIGCQTAEKSLDGSVEVIDIGLDDDNGSPSSKKLKIDEFVTPMRTERRNVPRSKRKTQKLADTIKPVTPKRKIRKKEPSTRSLAVKVISADTIKPVTPKRKIRKKEPSTRSLEVKVISEAEQNPISGSGMYTMQYVSNRMPITESDKQKALQLAQAALANGDSFVVVMRPTHVYKRFYMNIPSEFVHSHFSPVNQTVSLLYKENTWHARFNYDKVRGCGGLVGGWKNFAIENNIEEFDVCKFELASLAGTAVVMNVSIFRVVDELTPVTRVTSALPLRQKPSESTRKKSN